MNDPVQIDLISTYIYVPYCIVSYYILHPLCLPLVNKTGEISLCDDEEDARLGDSLLSIDVLTGGARGTIVETVAGRKGRRMRPGLNDGDGAEAMFREPTGIAVDSVRFVLFCERFSYLSLMIVKP